MLEKATLYYSQAADLIRESQKTELFEDHQELFRQLITEEIILFYKICKLKGLNYKKMLTYFTMLIDKSRNIDLLMKVTLDLLDTFQFKINDISSEEQYQYVARIEALLNHVRKIGKGSTTEIEDQITQISYRQAKLNLAFALILDN